MDMIIWSRPSYCSYLYEIFKVCLLSSTCILSWDQYRCYSGIFFVAMEERIKVTDQCSPPTPESTAAEISITMEIFRTAV